MVLVNNTVLSPIPSLICLILFSAISLILCIIYHRERNSLSTITTSFDEISGDEVNDDDDVESQSVLEPAEAIQKTYSDDQQDLNSDLSSSIISSFSVFDLEKSQIQWLRMFLIFNMIIMSLPLLLLYYFRDNSNKESSSLLIDLGLSLGTWLWMAVVIASLPLIWRGTSHGGEATVTAQLKLTHLISACVACSGILALKGVIQFYLQRESIGAANMVTILTTLNFLLPLLQTVCGVVIIQKTGTMIKILEEMAGLNNHDHHSASCNKLSFEKQSDIISFITFSWFNEMIRIGNSKTITLEDVWDLDRDDKTGSVFINYKRVNAGKNNSSCWISTLKGWMGNSSSSSKSNMPSSKKSMVPKLYYLSRSLIIFQIVCALSSSVFAFAGPYCLNKIVGLLATHRKGAELEAAVYVAGLFLCTIARSMCDGQNYFTGRRIGLRVRAIIINEIAAKSLRRAGFVGGGSSCGDGTDGQGDESKGQGTTTNHDNETTPLLKRRQKIHAQNDNDEIDGYFTSNPSSSSLESNVTNLMSVDAHKILEWSCYISYLISTPFQIILCIAMLLFVLGWPAVAGIVLMILMIPVGGALGKLVSVRQKKLMKASDVRISATNEVLSSIRIVKFFNWELSFLNKVTLLRNKELLSLKSYMISVAASRLAWWMCPILVSYSTFMVYTKVAGRDLDATTAFTALALFNTLRNPLQIFPDTIVKMVEALVSFGRIDDFLNETELEQEGDGGEEEEEVCGVGSGGVLRSAVSEEEEVSNPRLVSSFAAAKFINATFSWSDVLPDDDEDNNIHNDDYIPPLENRTSLASSGKSFRLQDLDFEFPRGKLSVVCGVTGSGKSSLLMALLGEMHRVKGHLQMMKSGQIAYASQQAWLQNATIRENICFGKQFNEQWYMTVIAACALTKDFKYLPAGDETEVGEKGLNLSGGQKQRISLARAVYSRADIILLDDPLSAVDAPTARHLFEECILKLLKGKTCILVSHAIQLCLPKAEFIVLMERGQTFCHGTRANVLSLVLGYFELCPEKFGGGSGSSGRVLLNVPGNACNSSGDNSSESRRRSISVRRSSEGSILTIPNSLVEQSSCDSQSTTVTIFGGGSERGDASAAASSGRLIEDEASVSGSVKLSVYNTYINAAGGKPFISLLIISYILAQGMVFVSDFWLKKWASDYDAGEGGGDVDDLPISKMSTAFLLSLGSYTPPASLVTASAAVSFSSASLSTPSPSSKVVNVDYYLEIYAMISVATILALLFRLIVLLYGSLKASEVLHRQLLTRMLGAPMRFFDTTPIGRLINRFSKDLQNIDQELASFSGDFLAYLVNGIALVVIISWVTPVFLLGMPPIALIYTLISRSYLNTSRELKRLDSTTRSPIYSHFGEMLGGATTIRAFGAQSRFIRENNQRVDTNHRAFFYLWVSNRWLSIRIDLIGAIVALFTGSAILYTSYYSLGKMDPGFAGLALTYTLTFTESLLWIVRMNALMEMSLNSVERVEEYLEINQEEKVDEEEKEEKERRGEEVSVLWPDCGEIEFCDASVRYASHLPNVLDGITLTIRGGESIGIVGRTGAGKSSLSLALFRFLDLSRGNILIDGVDVVSVGLSRLRRAMTIIPQDPTLFTGTIRSNMDPFGEYADEEICAALGRAHLLGGGGSGAGGEEESSSSSLLDFTVMEGGANYSQGQRQLLCLARAMLRKSRIIIMDEATASVDHETDGKIQRTIRSEFRGSSTVLCIAHRLKTVIEYDKILVLDKGRVVEFGSPRELLKGNASSGSLFQIMCQETGEMAELMEMCMG